MKKTVVIKRCSVKLGVMKPYNRIITTLLAGAISLSVIGAGNAYAAAPLPGGIQISQPGDPYMTCGQIADEVAALDDLILQTSETQEKSEQTSLGVDVVKTLGSYLIGTLTGTIGFIAVGHIASEAAGSRAEDAERIEDAARQRRSLMVGMHQIKTCENTLPDAPPPTEKIWPPLMHGTDDPADIEPAAGESGAAAGNDPAPQRVPLPHETKRYNG